MLDRQSLSRRAQDHRSDDLRTQAEDLIREMAFVLEATRLVKHAMLRDQPHRWVDDPNVNRPSVGTRRSGSL